MFFQDNDFGWRRASNEDAILREINLFKEQVATALDEYFKTQGKVDSFDYNISKNISGKSIGQVSMEYTPYVGQGMLFISAMVRGTMEGTIRITYGKFDPKFDPYKMEVKEAMVMLYPMLMTNPKGSREQQQLYFYFKGCTSVNENLSPGAKPVSLKPVVKPTPIVPKPTPVLETETAPAVSSKFTGFKPKRTRDVTILDPNETQYLTKAMVDKFPNKEVELTGFYDDIVGLPYYTSEFSKNGISLQDAIKRAIPNKIIKRGHNIRYGLKSYVKNNIIDAFSQVIDELGGDLGHETLTQASNEEIWVSAKSAGSTVSLYYTFYNMKLTVLRSPGDNARWNKVKIRNEDIASGFQEISVDFSWTKADYLKQIKSNKSMMNLLKQIVAQVKSPLPKGKSPFIQEPVFQEPIIQAPIIQAPTPKTPRIPKSVPTPKAPKVKSLSPVKPIPNRTAPKSTRLNPIQQKLSDALSFLSADLSLSSLTPTDVYVVIDEIKPITDKLPTKVKPLTSLTPLLLNNITSTFKTIGSTYDLQDLTAPELDYILSIVKPLMDKVPNLSFKNKKAFWF